jgi:hypothetical protein
VKKICVIFALVFLFSYNFSANDSYFTTKDNISNEMDSSKENLMVAREADYIKPIVAYRSNDNFSGYVVGGVINGEMISFQDNENYKLFDLREKEEYMFLSADGKKIPVVSNGFETNYIAANGTYEMRVFFTDKKFNSNQGYIGVGNYSKNIVNSKTTNVDGFFVLDFDNDGYDEKISVSKSENSHTLICLQNKNGESIISEFEIDKIYTQSFDIFAIDIDENGILELVISLNGHDYSTEIYKVTSNKCDKVVGYYMSN